MQQRREDISIPQRKAMLVGLTINPSARTTGMSTNGKGGTRENLMREIAESN
jgi:hypothetical protein